MSKKEESGFKVTDKRHFTSEGNILNENAPSEEEVSSSPGEHSGKPPAEARPDEGKSSSPPEAAGSTGPPEPIDFSHLVSFLATNALFQLGVVPDPVTGEAEVNLEAATQMIDFLGVLKLKSQGNLSADEESILTGALTELRSRFVAASGLVK